MRRALMPILLQAYINLEPLVTASTRSIKSLLFYAADAPMPAIKLEGLTVKNIVNGEDIASAGTVTFASISGHKYYDSLNAVILTGDGNNMTATNGSGAAADMMIIHLNDHGLEAKTASECAEMFPYYIDGLQNVAATRLTSVEKNRFDGSYKANTSISVSAGTEGDFATVSNARTTNRIRCKASTAYVVSGGNRNVWRFEDIGGNKITFASNNLATVTSPANAYWMYVYYSNDGTHTSVQIEEASTATTYSPFQKSSLYLPNGEYRSLPNLVCDKLEMQADGTFLKTQKVQEYTLQASDIAGKSSTIATNVDAYYTKIFTDMDAAASGRTFIPNTSGWVSFASADNVAYIGYHSTNCGEGRIYFMVAKGTYADLAAAQAALAGTVINYQLATPITSQIQPFGQLISKPSGTIYVDNILGDIGYYTATGIAVSGVVFDSIEEVKKIDMATGVETDVTSTCTLNANKDGFTSTGLSNGDLVWFALRIKDKPKGLATYGYCTNYLNL